MNYYVYCYIDDNKKSSKFGDYMFSGEPFYVGIGKNNRCYDHLLNAKKENYKYLPKHYKIKKMLNENKEPLIIKIIENLSKKEAIKNEMFFIDLIGRKDLNNGPLLNLTNGGEGGNTGVPWNKNIKYKNKKISNMFKGKGNPFYGKTHSEETKQKIGEANKGNSYKKGFKCSEKIKQKMRDNHLDYNGKNNPFYGKTHSEETKQKISEANKSKYTGDKNPAKRKDVRKKISIKKSKTYKIINPNGKIILYKGSLKTFCEENNLVVQLLRNVAKGRRQEYKGWKCKYLEPSVDIECHMKPVYNFKAGE